MPPLPPRCRVEGPRQGVARAVGILCDAVGRYKELCEGQYAGAHGSTQAAPPGMSCRRVHPVSPPPEPQQRQGLRVPPPGAQPARGSEVARVMCLCTSLPRLQARAWLASNM